MPIVCCFFEPRIWFGSYGIMGDEYRLAWANIEGWITGAKSHAAHANRILHTMIPMGRICQTMMPQGMKGNASCAN
jgi:hypothetical protein